MNRTVTKRPAQVTRARENGHKCPRLAPLFTGFPGKNSLKQKDVAKNTVKHTLSKHHFQHHFCQINHASLHRPSVVQKPTIPIRRAKETFKIKPCEKNKSCQPLGTDKQIKKIPSFFLRKNTLHKSIPSEINVQRRLGRENGKDGFGITQIWIEQTLYIWFVMRKISKNIPHKCHF